MSSADRCILPRNELENHGYPPFPRYYGIRLPLKKPGIKGKIQGDYFRGYFQRLCAKATVPDRADHFFHRPVHPEGILLTASFLSPPPVMGTGLGYTTRCLKGPACRPRVLRNTCQVGDAAGPRQCSMAAEKGPRTPEEFHAWSGIRPRNPFCKADRVFHYKVFFNGSDSHPAPVRLNKYGQVRVVGISYHCSQRVA